MDRLGGRTQRGSLTCVQLFSEISFYRLPAQAIPGLSIESQSLHQLSLNVELGFAAVWPLLKRQILMWFLSGTL